MLSEQQFYLFGQIQKDENKQKEAGRGPFCKRKRLPASVLGSQSKCLRWYWQEKGRDLHTLNPRDRWTDRKTGKQCDMYGMQMMMKKGILTNLGGKRECKRFFWTFRDKSFASKKRQIFEGFFLEGGGGLMQHWNCKRLFSHSLYWLSFQSQKMFIASNIFFRALNILCFLFL